MKNLFNNQFGFSLVQGMVIASVVAGSGLVATRLITDQKMAQKGAETRDQIEDLHQATYAALQNRDNCKATFLANGRDDEITGTSPTGTSTFDMTQIKSANGDPVLEIHNGDLNKTYMNGNVLVKSMNVNYNGASGKANLDIVYERMAGASLKDNSGTKAFDNTKKTKAGYGAKEIKKTITLRVQKNPFTGTKDFESCYGINTGKSSTMESGTETDINKDLCLQMNGNVASNGTATGLSVFVWDETTSTCLPNAKCPDHKVYTGISSTGAVLCKDIGDVVDFGTMVQPTPMTDTCGPGKNVYFEASADGKTVRIRCQ